MMFLGDHVGATLSSGNGFAPRASNFSNCDRVSQINSSLSSVSQVSQFCVSGHEMKVEDVCAPSLVASSLALLAPGDSYECALFDCVRSISVEDPIKIS